MGKKQTEFTGVTVLADGSFIGLFADGSNTKISKADFLSALGVTGTLTQIGSTTGAPVLQVDGPNFGIRNFEPGSGTIPLLTALNGLKINHNFNSGVAPSGSSAGVDILTNVTALSPTIRSLVAGNGAAIFANNGSITIEFTGAPASTGTVIVNSVADLPTPIGDAITLVTGTTYDPQGLIDISPFRLVVDTQSIELASNNRLSRGFTTDNTGALITAKGLNVVPIIREMLMLSPNGKVFDIQAQAGIVFNDVVNFDAAIKSTITDAANISFRNYTIASFGFGAPKGVEFFGACQEFNVSNGLFLDWDGTLFDFGTATFSNGLSLGPSARYDAASPNIVMEGLAANIPSGALGQVFDNKFLSTATVTSGFDESTLGYEFSANQGISNTMADSLSTNTAGVGVTIASAGVPVKIAGTWVDEGSSQFTVDGSGRVTYNGLKSMSTPITASVALEPVSGTNVTVGVTVAINGTAVPNSLRTAAASSGSPASITMPWQETLTTGDFVELFASNEDGTTNLIASSAVNRLN